MTVGLEQKKNAQDLKGVIRKIDSIIEVVLLMTIYYFMWKYHYRYSGGPVLYGNGKYMLLCVYALITSVLFFLLDSFKFGHRKLTEVIVSQWIAVLFTNTITYFQLCLLANVMTNVVPMLVLTLIDSVVVVICTYIYTMLYHLIYVPKNMIMIYGSKGAVDLKFKMDTRPDKYCVTKVISYTVGLHKIMKEIQGHDAVIINDVPAQIRNDITKYCYANEIRTYLVPKISDIISRGAEEISLFDTPLLLVKGRGLNLVQRILKRTMDLMLCVIAMVPGIILMGIVAICIKCEDGGPVFYKQERVTRGGKKFHILKFRSMVVDAEKDGKSVPATDNDSRVTKVGKVIRAMRVDEFPQVLNILKGDMSWVGPRPERTEHVEKYTKEIPEFAFRAKVKGGLTGYAQIYGKYNTSAYDKLRLDLIYIENYSLLLDIKLILMTVQVMFEKESTEGFRHKKEIERMRERLFNDSNGDRTDVE